MTTGSRIRATTLVAAGAALTAVLAAAPASGQSTTPLRPSIAAVGGLTEYDLSGTGTRRFAGVRAQIPLSGTFIIEPGITYFGYRNQGFDQGPRWNVWLPEVHAQAQLRLGAFRPYVGAGAGVSFERLDGSSYNDPTLSIATGLRVDLPAHITVGGEVRVRAIDPWTGSTGDFGLLLAWRL